MNSLDGRVAVVTGGARGIGRAIVERLAAEGAKVAALDIDLSETEDLPAAACIRCDVRSEDDVRSAITETTNRLGPPLILVNNAGVNAYYDATAVSEQDWDALFAVDLKGAWLCCKHAIPAMVAAGAGSVINISSIHAQVTTRGMFPYAAAKAGLVGMTRNLALDYAPYNVRVNAICPGFIRTHLVQEWLDLQPDRQDAEAGMLRAHPLGRIGTVQEVANVAWFLASDQASYITGASILVDGGLSARFAT